MSDAIATKFGAVDTEGEIGGQRKLTVVPSTSPCRHRVDNPAGGLQPCRSETAVVTILGGNQHKTLRVVVCATCDQAGEWPEEGSST